MQYWRRDCAGPVVGNHLRRILARGETTLFRKKYNVQGTSTVSITVPVKNRDAVSS